MAFGHPMTAAGYVAAADLSASQYLFVKMGTNADEVILCGDGEDAVGVLCEPANDTEAACVAVGGQSKVVAGAAVTVGAKLACDAAGKAVVATTGDVVMGTALAAGALDEVITIQLDKEGVLA